MTGTTIVLSTVKPSQNALITQMDAALGLYGSWQDRIVSSTGRTLIDFIAAVGAYDQFTIESSFQEVFPESAKNTLSLYAASTYLGVRLTRKGPASVPVLMSVPVSYGTVTIPPYSQFTGAGTFWFNRVALTLTNTPTSVTLYQGKMVLTTVTGQGTDFQAFVSPEKDFVVSDIDVFVYINSASIQVTTAGLWTCQGIPGIQNLTLSDGRLMLLFGNTAFGSRPGATDAVAITYVITQGADGNNITVSGQNIQLAIDQNVVGAATSQASGGGSQPNPLIYKSVTPALFGAFDAAVTPPQYKALPLQYPGVIDALTFAQREVNPNSLSWMNLIKVCLLTQTPFSLSNWNDFVAWYSAKTMYVPRLFRLDPVANTVNVNVSIFCKSFSNLTNVQANAVAAVQALFAPRQGIIGLDIYRSDIDGIIKDSDSNIDYMIINNPSTDLIISNSNVVAPTLGGTTGGSLVVSQNYDYAISYDSSLTGSSAPANWATISLTGSQTAVTLAWSAVPNATAYHVWGRIAGSYGLIATVSNSTFAYTDTGGAVTGSPPTQSTTPILYSKLGTLTITPFYSNRLPQSI